MPLWIFLLIAGVCAAIILGPWAVGTGRTWAYQWRHAKHVLAEAEAEFGPPDSAFRGSMNYYDEHPERAGHFPPTEEWNRANAATGADWDHRTAFYNGHTFGCLMPDVDHLGACPEEGDWPDDWGPDVPYLPAPEPVEAGPDVLDAVLALEAEDPAAAGWTDQLLADLHHAPSVLDGGLAGTCDWGDCDEPANGWRDDLPVCARHAVYVVEPSRMADTGEIELAGLRAEYAAELRAQDDDAAEFISRKASEAAGLRLTLHGLA